MRRVTLTFTRFKGGPGDKVMWQPPPFSHPRDPYKQDSQPSHRFQPIPPPAKTAADPEFMQYQIEKFQLGKRHLANMMGVHDSELMTQEDIDKSIRYLFPTGIFSSRSKPIMKDPLLLFPSVKRLDVDEQGRPRNPFFYSGNKAFNTICFMIADCINKADEDMMRGEKPTKHLPYDPKRQRWLDDKQLGALLMSNMNKEQMVHFNSLIQRLAVHSMAFKYESVLDKFRVKAQQHNQQMYYPFTPTEDNTNCEDPFTLADDPYNPLSIATGKKKTARAKVELRPCKEGEEPVIRVNDMLLSEHFDYVQDREQVIFPLTVTKMYGKFHINITAEGGGRSGQSNSARLALSRAMIPFISEECVEKLRLSGLLMEDIRRKERNKINQHGPRRKKQFRKR